MRLTFRTALRTLAAAGLLAGAAATAAPAGAAPATSHTPVILVHGWNAGDAPAAFKGIRTALEAAGHPVYLADLPGEMNVANAAAIGRLADKASAEHGGTKVDLVAHSMGGLSARYYLKYLGGTSRVSHYVSMGTGQYGLLPGCLLPADNGGEMCTYSPFLANLNRGDDTPSDVSYTTLRGVEDDSSASGARHDRSLDGGACVRDGVDGGPHPGEPNNAVFIALVQEALNGHCPGAFVNLPIAD